jgi:hypothetical protein
VRYFSRVTVQLRSDDFLHGMGITRQQRLDHLISGQQRRIFPLNLNETKHFSNVYNAHLFEFVRLTI